jgi:hypothetical protein
MPLGPLKIYIRVCARYWVKGNASFCGKNMTKRKSDGSRATFCCAAVLSLPTKATQKARLSAIHLNGSCLAARISRMINENIKKRTARRDSA